MSKNTDDVKRKISDRIHSCVCLFEELKQHRNWPEDVYLNLAVLENSIEQYFYDLGTTKDHHMIKVADHHKRAAFTLKWLIKLRPVQFQRSIVINHKDLMLANEIFTVYVALAHLRLSFDDIDHKWFINLLYTLRYRDFNAEVMASEMYLLEKLAKP